MGGDYQVLQPVRRKSHLQLQGLSVLRLELITMNPYRREDQRWKDGIGKCEEINNLILHA